MSDADKSLKIGIDIDPGQSIAKAAAVKTGIEDISKATETLGPAGTHADAFEQDLERVEHRVGGVTGQSRELYRAFYAIDRIVPGLGEVMRGSMEEGGMGIAALLISVQALQEILKEMNGLADVQAAKFEGTAEATMALRDAYDKVDIAAQLFIEDLIRQNAEGATAADIAKRQIDNVHNLAAAQEAYNNAQKKLSEAQIDEQEENGVITHAQALNEKFALDVEYTRKKLALDAATDAHELAAKQQQLATEQKQLAALEKDRTGDEANARASTGAKARHDRQMETDKKNVEEAQKTLDELAKSKGSLIQGRVDDESVSQLKEYFEKYVGGDSGKTDLSDQFLQLQEKMKTLTDPASWDFGLTKLIDHTIGSQQGPAALAKYQGAQQQMSGAQADISRLEKTQFDVDLNAERGKKQLDATDDNIRRLSESVKALSALIPQTQADNTAKEANAAGVANLDLRAKAVQSHLPDPGNIFTAPSAAVAAAPMAGDPANAATPGRNGAQQGQYHSPGYSVPTSDIAAGSRARDDQGQFTAGAAALQHGQQLGHDQMAMMQRVAEMMTGHAMTQQAMLAFAGQLVTSQKTRDQAFEHQLATLRAQMAATQSNSK